MSLSDYLAHFTYLKGMRANKPALDVGLKELPLTKSKSLEESLRPKRERASLSYLIE